MFLGVRYSLVLANFLGYFCIMFSPSLLYDSWASVAQTITLSRLPSFITYRGYRSHRLYSRIFCKMNNAPSEKGLYDWTSKPSKHRPKIWTWKNGARELCEIFTAGSTKIAFMHDKSTIVMSALRVFAREYITEVPNWVAKEIKREER